MAVLLDDFADWTFALDEAGDAQSAWQCFEAICRKADTSGVYSTETLAGRAVELLAPRLDFARLTEASKRLLHSGDGLSWMHWTGQDRVHFGIFPSGKMIPKTGRGLAGVGRSPLHSSSPRQFRARRGNCSR